MKYLSICWMDEHTRLWWSEDDVHLWFYHDFSSICFHEVHIFGWLVGVKSHVICRNLFKDKYYWWNILTASAVELYCTATTTFVNFLWGRERGVSAVGDFEYDIFCPWGHHEIPTGQSWCPKILLEKSKSS